MSQSTGVPTLPIPYVTDTAGNSYSVAAVVISETPIDNVFNITNPPLFPPPLTLPSLCDKNLLPHVATNPRQYNAANTANVAGPPTTYGDLVAEVTYGDLYNKACNSQNTRLAVFAPPAPLLNSVKIPSGGSCYTITTITPAYLSIGQAIDYYAGCPDCITICTSMNTYTYQQLSNTDWTSLNPTARNGQVNANNTDHQML